MLLAVYRLGPDYQLELSVADRSAAVREDGLVKLCLTEKLVTADIEESALGELVASLLLLRPTRIGDESLFWSFAAKYYERITVEEASRLRKLLRENIERTYIADIYPAIARLARLQRVLIWLKPSLYEECRRPVFYEWLRSLARAAGIEARYVRASDYAGAARKRRITRLTYSIPPSPSLVNLVDPSLILEALSAKTPPILRDPLLLVKLDGARIATRLVDFEEQLFAITSVRKALRRVKSLSKDKVSPIRSVEKVTIEGFKTAIVKKYRDITAVKWIVAAIASIPLPKPRLNPLSRLNAEYYYNRLLWEKGFNVPNPLLLDPRRRMAAYEYVEGMDLAQLLQKSPVPPVYREMGATLAEVHAYGVVLWDTNPSNFIDTPKGLYIVDLEQARRSSSVEEMAWDIALAAYFSAIYTPKEAATRARLIVDGYLSAGGGREVVAEASKPRYAIPFLVAVPPNTIERIRKAIASAAERGNNY